MDADQQVRQLKQDIEQLQRSKARADMEQDAARASLSKLKTRLKDEFGVTDSAAATEVLEGLKSRLDEELEKAFAAVRKAQNG